MRKAYFLTILLACLTGALLAGLDTPQPLIDPPRPGRLTGQITPPGRIKTLRAVSRVTGREYPPTKLDRTSGVFVFADLPGSASYDLVVTTTDGRTFEGIDLEFVDARLGRLAELHRRALDLPATEPVFTPDDAEAILAFIRAGGREDFMDTRRTLYLTGRGPRGVALVELLRTRAFHESASAAGPQIVWRVELWYFRREGVQWRRLGNVHRVLRRLRGSPGQLRAIDVEYYPALSGFIDRLGRSTPISFPLPKTPDATRGRPAESTLRLPDKPHIVAPPVTAEPSTRPARTRPTTQPGPAAATPAAEQPTHR